MEFPNFLDPEMLYNVATSHGFEYWLGLGINLIVSTIIGGLLLVIITQVVSHIFSEPTSPENAFLVTLIANVINYFGVMGLLVSFVSWMPLAGLLVPVLVWIVLIKIFFSELSFLHSAVIGIIFYALTIFVIPYAVGYVANIISI